MGVYYFVYDREIFSYDDEVRRFSDFLKSFHFHTDQYIHLRSILKWQLFHER